MERDLLLNRAPPACNTGVQSAGAERSPARLVMEMEAMWAIDWLELTFADGTGLTDALPGVDPSSWRREEHGRMGYSERYTYLGAEVLRHGRSGMGVHLTLGGTAIRYVAASPSGLDLGRYVELVAAGGVNCSRVDFAVDTFGGSLTRERIARYWSQGWVTSRWDSWQQMTGGKRGSGQADGWTFYLGSKASDARLRIYDKRAERLVKGGREEALAPNLPDSWVRVEFQLRDETACAALRVLHSEGQAGLASSLLGYLAFREPSENEQVTRWPVAQWWAVIMEAVASRPMHIRRPDGDLAATVQWLTTQAAPSLAAVAYANGGDLHSLAEIAAAGRYRIRGKLRHRLEAAGVPLTAPGAPGGQPLGV